MQEKKRRDGRKSVACSSPDVDGKRLDALLMCHIWFYKLVGAMKVDCLTGFEGSFKLLEEKILGSIITRLLRVNSSR